MRHVRLRIASEWVTVFVTLGAVGMLSVSGAAPAAAAAATPTQIADFTVSPSVVTYPNPQITVAGVLETAGSSPQPLARTTVHLSFRQGADEDGSDVFTDAAGHFKFLTTQVVPAPVVARYLGDALYGASSATASVTAAQVYPAKIVLDPIAPAPVFSIVTVTGTLLMQLPDGSWVPSPDASVGEHPIVSYLPTFTDLNGKFAVGAEVDPGVPLTISAAGGWSGDATSGPLLLPLSADPTWVCGAVGPDFTPAPVAGIGFEIHSCYVDAAGARHNYSGEAQLYFQPAGGSKWTLMATTRTGADGFGHVTVSGYLRGGGLAAGNWRWKVPAAPGFAASDSGVFSVVISVPTKITGVRFARSGAQERLTGRLSYQTAGVPGATVLIEHFMRGRWRQVAVVRTNGSGGFAYQFSPRLTGMYRVAYRGHALPGAEASYGSFAPALSGAVDFR